MPQALAAQLSGLTGMQIRVVLRASFMLAPMLLIMPLMFSARRELHRAGSPTRRKTHWTTSLDAGWAEPWRRKR